jgi:hypothetical protein
VVFLHTPIYFATDPSPPYCAVKYFGAKWCRTDCCRRSETGDKHRCEELAKASAEGHPEQQPDLQEELMPRGPKKPSQSPSQDVRSSRRDVLSRAALVLGAGALIQPAGGVFEAQALVLETPKKCGDGRGQKVKKAVKTLPKKY